MLATVTPFASFIALILAVFRVANKDRDDRNVRGHVHSGMLLKIGNTELAQSLPGCQETIENKRLVVGAGDGNRTLVRSLGSLQFNSKDAGMAAFLRFSERLNWKIVENGKWKTATSRWGQTSRKAAVSRLSRAHSGRTKRP